jgi:hypothetical protein
LLLLQVPPVVAHDSIADVPAHNPPGGTPVIDAGKGFTVTMADVLQPDVLVYIIVEVPALMPITSPLDGSTVACVPVTDQRPPGDADANVVEDPTHTLNVPVTGNGRG